MSESNNKLFPELLKKLPKVDYSSDGAEAIRVLEGECELVIEGESKIYGAGDVYHVPEGVLHFARQSANYKDIVIFNEPGRIPVLR